MPHIFDLRKIAQVEFGDIVQSVFDLDYKLRIILVWISSMDSGGLWSLSQKK